MQLSNGEFWLRCIPGECGAKVLVIRIQPLQPFSLGWARDFTFGSPAQSQKEIHEPGLHHGRFVGFSKPLRCVLAYGLEHPITHNPFTLLHYQKRFVDEPANRIENVRHGQFIVSANRF